MILLLRLILVFILFSTSYLLHAEAKPLIYPHDNSLYANIHILSATFGKNCGVKRGNATLSVIKKCNGKEYCYYVVSTHNLGDPAPGCIKDFQVKWTCGVDKHIHQASLSAKQQDDARSNKKILITCGIN